MNKRTHVASEYVAELVSQLATIHSGTSELVHLIALGDPGKEQICRLADCVERSGNVITQIVEQSGVGGVVPIELDGQLGEAGKSLEDSLRQLQMARDCATLAMRDLLEQLQESTQVARAYHNLRSQEPENESMAREASTG